MYRYREVRGMSNRVRKKIINKINILRLMLILCKCIKINCTIVIMNGIEGIFISYGGKMMDYN